LKTLVFATDSEYVVEGATKWVKGWLKNGWKTAKGGSVKNKDLWEMLLGEVELLRDGGMKIEFWRIGRELNTMADKLAKDGAAIIDAPDNYGEIFSI
jgi:ribonuclease HI